MTAPLSPRAPFVTRALRGVLAGLPGVLALPFLAPLPPGLPVWAVMANPALLLVAMALAGAWAAPKAGLGSALILRSPWRGRGLAVWAGAGLLAGGMVAVLDHAAAPFWAAPGMASLREGRTLAEVVLGILYGGLTEEVLFRWGLMALLAVALMRVLPKGARGRRAALWGAAGIAALAFALAHLPAVAMGAEAVTPALLLRTVLWNAVLGMVYAAALLRQGLEGAITAHAATHLGFALVAI